MRSLGRAANFLPSDLSFFGKVFLISFPLTTGDLSLHILLSLSGHRRKVISLLTGNKYNANIRERENLFYHSDPFSGLVFFADYVRLKCLVTTCNLLSKKLIWKPILLILKNLWSFIYIRFQQSKKSRENLSLTFS